LGYNIHMICEASSSYIFYSYCLRNITVPVSQIIKERIGNEMGKRALPIKRYLDKLWSLHERQKSKWVNKRDDWDDESIIRVSSRIDEVNQLIKRGIRYYVPF